MSSTIIRLLDSNFVLNLILSEFTLSNVPIDPVNDLAETLPVNSPAPTPVDNRDTEVFNAPMSTSLISFAVILPLNVTPFVKVAEPFASISPLNCTPLLKIPVCAVKVEFAFMLKLPLSSTP